MTVRDFIQTLNSQALVYKLCCHLNSKLAIPCINTYSSFSRMNVKDSHPLTTDIHDVTTPAPMSCMSILAMIFPQQDIINPF